MILHRASRNGTVLTLLSVLLCSFVLSFTVALIPFYANAQIVPELNNVIVLDVAPTYPRAQERVTLSAKSFSIDLDTSTLSWFINDTLQQQSVGETFFRFTTGKLGSKTKIRIVAQTQDGAVHTEQITIRPTDIDLLWQAHTFAHPFYSGKRIPSVGSSINIEVIPHFIDDTGKRLDESKLIYSWRVDNKALKNASGRGKNTIMVSQIKPVNSLLVTVEVTSSDNVLFGKRSVSIPIRDNELFVYENNPLLGILFNKAIRGIYSLTLQETKFIAYPFFMSFSDRNASNINYVWKLNNNPIALGDDRGSITVSHDGTEAGEANISVSINNTEKIFQKSSAEFNIKFGKDFSSGF